MFSADLKEEMSKTAKSKASFKGCIVGANAPKHNSRIHTQIMEGVGMTRRGLNIGALGTPLKPKSNFIQAKIKFETIIIYAFKSTAATISYAQKAKQEAKSPSRVEKD